MGLADVVELPVRRTTEVAGTVVGSAADTIRRVGDQQRRWGRVDDWGRDAGMFRLVSASSDIRWDVSTGGADRLPPRRGALVVVNAQRLAMTQVFASFAISRATGRPTRFVGRPDDSVLGAFAQRIGGLIDDPDEVADALRAKQLVLVCATATSRPREVGEVDHRHVGAAMSVGAPIIAAASTATPFSRRARVEIGTPVKPPRRRRGPLAELELADQVRTEIGRLLEQMGDINTGTPLDWLPMSGMGGN